MTANKILLYISGALLLIILPIIYKIVYPLFPLYADFKTGYDIIITIPYIFITLGLFVAVRIKDSRAFWNTLLFLLTYIILINFQYIQFSTLQLSDVAQSLSVFIPILIILISIRSAKKFSVKEFITQFLIVASGIALSFILPVYFKAFFNIAFSSHIFINHPNWQLPDYIWFLLIIMYALLYMKIDSNSLPLLITVTILVFLLFQCFNLAAIINEPTHEVKLYTALLYSGMGIFPMYYMLFSYNRKEFYDNLTALPNEKYLQKIFKKFNNEVSLSIIEIDHFEEFVDKYGKEEGANVLRFLSSHLNTESDVGAYRLDSSKFALVYNKVNSDEVLWQLNSIREKLSHKKFIIRKSQKDRQKSGKYDRGKLEIKPNDITFTISVGIARKSESINTYEQLIKEALYALKSAKSKGGNRCLRAEDITY